MRESSASSAVAPGVGVGGDVADHIAGGLHGVQPDLGQLVKDIRRITQLYPVELQVRAGGEVAVALVVGPRHVGQPAKLVGRQRPVGDGDPQHVGVQLQIEAVHQAQGLELVLGQLARQPPAALFAELAVPVGQEFLVDGVVAVHGGDLLPLDQGQPGPWSGPRRGRGRAPRCRVRPRPCLPCWGWLVGPSARTRSR